MPDRIVDGAAQGNPAATRSRTRRRARIRGGHCRGIGVRLDCQRAAERAKARIGPMPKGLGVKSYPELSVEGNVDFFARQRRADEALIGNRGYRKYRLNCLAA
jgi:hypothetical protein